MVVLGFGEIMLRLSTNKGQMITQCNNFEAHYGGGEANVLVSLSNYGLDTRMLTSVSNDDIGKSITNYLASHNVDTKFIDKKDKRTGIYFLQVGSGNRVSKVIYDRADSAFANMQVGDIDIEKALEGVDIFHFSGVTLALSSELRKLTIKILEHCKKNNIMVSYDSNYRSKLWSLEDARKATLEILPYVNLLSAGMLDAENILLMKCDSDDKYKKLKYYYDEINKIYPNIKYIFSSMRGIISSSLNTLQCNYYAQGNLFSSSIITIDDIIDRVGGGDSLTAGIIYSIANNKSPEYTCEFAAAASVLKHSIYGDGNLVCVEDVENLMYNGVERISR